MIQQFVLPEELNGRNIFVNVIPTVCNLKNMLNKLKSNNWNEQALKPWEKRSYNVYRIDLVINKLKNVKNIPFSDIIRTHILTNNISMFGPNIVDIYLVAYFAENYSTIFTDFFEFAKEKAITEKEGSAKAIWQVGKGDGIFLEILNDDGTIKDWTFIKQWLKLNQ